jgi:3-phenylpropionate/trans-cinnamate dioxygenase ferredoxin reductase component
VRTQRSVLIVGAGLAGSRCAETLRAEGFDGRIVIVGDEPMPPYARPALSKEFLLGDRKARSLALRPDTFWAEHEIELVLGRRVISIDRRSRVARTDREGAFEWEVLVLATGARARRLPFASPAGVHTLRTAADAIALREELVPGRRLVVVGGGFVGAEVASTAQQLGVDVTMLEAGSAPFTRVLGKEIGSALAARYAAYGVDVRTNTHAVAFRRGSTGRVRAVVLRDGNELACDVALVAVGMEAAVELLPSPVAPPVFVCGDAAGGAGHWTSAATSAANTARVLLGREPRPAGPSFFWSDQFDLRLQLVGAPQSSARVELQGGGERFTARYLDAGGRLIAALVVNQPEEIASLRRELALAA